MKRFPWVETVLLLGVIVFCGFCTRTVVSCWHRGGTVVKNAFDYPTCIAAVPR